MFIQQLMGYFLKTCLVYCILREILKIILVITLLYNNYNKNPFAYIVMP